MRFVCCWIGGALAGWAVAMGIVYSLMFTVGLSTDAATGLALILGMLGGCAGTTIALLKWGAL